ncbi:MAG: PAS domain-containing protein [Oceanicaulis sp.]
MAENGVGPERTGRLEQILDSIAAFVVIMDANGRMREINADTVRAGGAGREALIGESLADAPWWLSETGQADRLRDALATARKGETVCLEMLAADGDARRLPVALTLAPIRDEAGAVSEIVATAIDLSGQRLAEDDQASSAAKAERRLAELEALYDALPVGVALHDREMRFLRVNKRMAEIDGLPVEAHLGRKGDELLPGVDPKVTRIVKSIFETGEPVLGLEVKAEIPSDPGEMRDFIADYYPVKVDGEVVAVGTCVREVTRERRLKREAVEAEGKLRRLLDTIPATATIHEGPDHKIVYANPASLGYLSQADVVGRPMREAIPEFDDEVFDRMDTVYRTGEPVIDQELSVPGLDGAVFYSALLPWRLEDGSVGGVIGFGYDITDQVGAREEMERSSMNLRAVLDCTLALVAVIDGEGRVSDVNAAAATLFGLDRDTVTGAPFADALWSADSDSSALVRDAVALALNGQGIRFDVEFQAPGGASGVLDLMLSPEKDATGAVRRVIASAFDITERKEAAERIEMLLQEVNHRSKNMLGLVQAVARQTRGGDLEEYRDKFQRRLAGLSAAQDLVTAHDWGDVELVDLIENQLGAFSGELGGRIKLDGPRDVLVSARAAQNLGMAIHELVTNAGKYGALSNADGVVTLSWRREPDGLAISWVEAGGPEVSAPEAAGFGSLVIDTVVADALGGEVTIEYAPQGLRWRLTGGRAVAQAANDRRRGRGRVLIVEDEALIAADLAYLLTEAGYEVIGPAPSVKQALALVSREGCDAAVLDVNLGEVTSEPVAAALNARGAPYVTVSGYAARHRPETMAAAPALTKPVEHGELLAALKAIMPAR